MSNSVKDRLTALISEAEGLQVEIESLQSDVADLRKHRASGRAAREYGKTSDGVSYTDLSRDELIQEASKRGLLVAAEAKDRGPDSDYPIWRAELHSHLEAHDHRIGLQPPTRGMPV